MRAPPLLLALNFSPFWPGALLCSALSCRPCLGSSFFDARARARPGSFLLYFGRSREMMASSRSLELPARYSRARSFCLSSCCSFLPQLFYSAACCGANARARDGFLPSRRVESLIAFVHYSGVMLFVFVFVGKVSVIARCLVEV